MESVREREREIEMELKVCSMDWRESYVTGAPPGFILQLTKSWKLV